MGIRNSLDDPPAIENLPEVISELDAMHARTKAAFDRKDLDAYMAVFSPYLRYRELNGEIIDCAQLRRDLQAQFQLLSKSQLNYTREGVEVVGDTVAETIYQVARLSSRVFFVFHRTCNVTRRGRCIWVRTDDGWQIEQMDVLEETVGRRRFHIGFHAPDLAQ
jgi:hypothetical protein